jgi:hypothetical protein
MIVATEMFVAGGARVMFDQLEENPVTATLRACFGWAAIATAVGTVVGAVALNPLVLPVGAAAWIAAVYLTGPARLKKQVAAARKRAEMMASLPPRLRQLAEDIAVRSTRIKEAIQGADDSVRLLLVGLEVEVEHLVEAADVLLHSAGRLHAYLRDNGDADLDNRTKSLQARIEASNDEFSRSQLEEALTQMQAEQQARAENALLLQRVEASLRNMEASLGGVHSQVVGISSGERVSPAELEAQSFEQIAEVRSSVAALQEVIDTQVNDA